MGSFKLRYKMDEINSDLRYQVMTNRSTTLEEVFNSNFLVLMLVVMLTNEEWIVEISEQFIVKADLNNKALQVVRDLRRNAIILSVRDIE